MAARFGFAVFVVVSAACSFVSLAIVVHGIVFACSDCYNLDDS